MNKLEKKIDALPEATGVYIFKDARGRILYIGKAKSLKKRVESYFKRPLDSKNQALVRKIADLDYRLALPESQAQILEASLIKANQPQYNIDLKDDKSFPWIRITQEKFPLVSIYRRKGRQKQDKSLYFGPYTNVKLLRQAFKFIRKIFGFRSCKKLPKESCLYYRLQLCPAPCIGKISARKYKEIINQIQMFLDSRYEKLVSKLSEKMKEASGERRFEEAARIRDQINALSAIAQNQSYFKSQDELQGLKNLLKLKVLPERIEAFDISNISGQEATGSLVSFYKGVADKNNYRRFRIKTVEGADDYKSLREVMHRRYSRLVKENLALPDLIIIDGGRSHLLTAQKALRKLGISLALASIAKERENIYIKNRQRPIKLTSDTPALNLIRRIRNEAHRFAVSYHHILRRKKIIGK